jgi:DNA-binding MarR family transcriptional regulator
MEDYPAEMGSAALGARLRRLSAAIDADAARVYAAQGIRFEQRWFGVLNQLALGGPMGVQDLANVLGITHVSVSQTRASLEKAGLVTSRADPEDSRRRILALSPSGQAMVERLRPLWDVFDEAARQLDAEAGEIVAALARLEQALARKSLHARITEIADGQ